MKGNAVALDTHAAREARIHSSDPFSYPFLEREKERSFLQAIAAANAASLESAKRRASLKPRSPLPEDGRSAAAQSGATARQADGDLSWQWRLRPRSPVVAYASTSESAPNRGLYSKSARLREESEDEDDPKSALQMRSSSQPPPLAQRRKPMAPSQKARVKSLSLSLLFSRELTYALQRASASL